jgi:hypothetical protein
MPAFQQDIPGIERLSVQQLRWHQLPEVGSGETGIEMTGP